jgi:hypothetical protein
MGPEVGDWAVDEQLAELGRVLSKRIDALAGRRGVRRHRRPASQWQQHPPHEPAHPKVTALLPGGRGQ